MQHVTKASVHWSTNTATPSTNAVCCVSFMMLLPVLALVSWQASLRAPRRPHHHCHHRRALRRILLWYQFRSTTAHFCLQRQTTSSYWLRLLEAPFFGATFSSVSVPHHGQMERANTVHEVYRFYRLRSTEYHNPFTHVPLKCCLASKSTATDRSWASSSSILVGSTPLSVVHLLRLPTMFGVRNVLTSVKMNFVASVTYKWWFGCTCPHCSCYLHHDYHIAIFHGQFLDAVTAGLELPDHHRHVFLQLSEFWMSVLHQSHCPSTLSDPHSVLDISYANR